MPTTDEDIIRDLLHRYTDDVRPSASTATQVAARQRYRDRRRVVSIAATGAALGAAAGVIAVVPGHSSPPPPRPVASGKSPSRAPAADSKLMSLAAFLQANSGPLPGNASLIISTQTIGGKRMEVLYNLYTDRGAYYVGDTKQGLIAAVEQHENIDNGTDARQVAAARYAATGDLATARVRMANVTSNDLGLGLPPAARKKIWDQARAQADVILKEKGANFTLPVNPPAGKALRSDVDNLVWMNGIDALTEGGGSPLVRAGVLRLLSTISGLTVVKSTTDGQSTLTLTAGPEVFGGAGKNVVVINAKTGLPISSWTGDLPPSVHGQPTPASMTTYQVSRVTVANIEAGKF
jgi:hypothetical protein